LNREKAWRVDRAISVSLVLLAVVAIASLIAGCGGSDSDLSDGAKVDMGGWSLYIQCEGTGSPTVVLDAGFYDSHSVWKPVEAAVARGTRTCSYDRSGVGQSDVRPSRPAVVPAEQVVDELNALLATADVPPPFVVVGHSLGGINAWLFTARHASDVAGLVLVDPAYDFGSGATERELKGAAISYRTASDLVRSTRFGNRPAIVLVSGQERAITTGAAVQVAKRSSNGLAMETPTGHSIHLEAPKLVVEAINLVVGSARSHTAMPPCRETRLMRLGGECLP
jgi:predicted alpha/beta hydrolase family esterase